MNGLTVDELIQLLQKVSNEGHGNKRVCLDLDEVRGDEGSWYACVGTAYTVDFRHNEVDFETIRREDS